MRERIEQMIREYMANKTRRPGNIIMGSIAYKSLVIAESNLIGAPTFPRHIEGIPIITVDDIKYAGVVLLGDKPDATEI